MDFFSILTLLGGLAMFLYGMQVRETDWKSFQEESLRRFLRIFLQTD